MCYPYKAMGIQEEQTSCKTISTTESAKLHEQLPFQNIVQQTIRRDSTAQKKGKSHHKPQYEQMRMQWQASLMTPTVHQIIEK